MLFNSIIFIYLFLPLVLSGYRLSYVWKGALGAKCFLVLSSLFFYGWWNYKYLILIIGSVLFNFFAGSFLEKNTSKKIKLFGLIAGVGVNLFLLAYFKYAGFLMSNLGWVFSTEYFIDQIILPLGISFFTFQQITYLVDSYKGLTQKSSFYDYALFVLFFPQLIAGPIVHHGQMLSQFQKSETFVFQWKTFSLGLSVFVFGLSKKMLIADPMSENVQKLYHNLEGLSFLDAWVGMLSYSMQIYFDFSGYSDMAIGLAYLFGIKLPLNFNSPYKADSIIEFWRRWHMTLSAFLKDYLYIPLGGNRFGNFRKYVNLFITMLLGGLWHGAGWSFVLWGALHGFYLIINHIYRSLGIRVEAMFYKTGCRISTFLAVLAAWVFFRSASLNEAFLILEAMFYFEDISKAGLSIFESKVLTSLILVCLVAFFCPNTQEVFHLVQKQNSIMPKWAWSPTKKWAYVISVLLLVCTFSVSKASEFLYYQF